MNDNITPPQGYRHTGNTHPIQPDILEEYVTQQLAIYDQVATTGQDLSFSPYSDPILYNAEGGKVVQVPEDVQKQAISRWLRQKQQPMNPQPIPDEVQQRNPDMLPRNLPPQMREQMTPQMMHQMGYSPEHGQQIQQEPMYDEEQHMEETGVSRNKMFFIVMLVAAGAYFYYKKYKERK